MLIAWLSATLVLSAALLFLLQPMFARMVLPQLGGTPAVWNTCMLFFQAALLAAYGYAHVSTRRSRLRRQSAWHVGLMLVPLLVLPVAVPPSWVPPEAGSPALWLLGVLTLRVGLPFFAVAATAPLVQRWLAASSHPAARDPYFLYAASNAGSLLGLLAYPLLVEPHLRLADQGRWWTAGYVLLIGAIAGCVYLLRGTRAVPPELRAAAGAYAPVPSRADKLWWLALSAVPSSLLLGVTAYIATDLASFPLLWIVPLTLYLLTFIAAFAGWPPVPAEGVYRILCLLVLPLAIFMASGVDAPAWLVPWHLTVFVTAAYLCHRLLADRRPAPAHLTGYYLWISLGGALGGLANGLIAPVVFRTIAEYPLAIVLACAAPAAMRARGAVGRADVLWALGVGAGALALSAGVRSAGAELTPVGDGLVFLLPAVACYALRRRPVRFALCLGAFLMIHLGLAPSSHVLHRARSFFGVHRVVAHQEPGDAFATHLLMHGRTLHGAQSRDPSWECEPLSYFNRRGPLGTVMESVDVPKDGQVAVIGLGAGSVAGYQRPDQAWTYYEIDPAVAAIAGDARYFTFLSRCAAHAEIVLGDGRRRIAEAADGAYHLIIIDAFSSASIPVHLLTREAIELYLRKLAPGGSIAFHISNRYFDLERVLGAACRDTGAACVARQERGVEPDRAKRGHRASHWLVIAREEDGLGALRHNTRWHRVDGAAGFPAWTDDFSNLLGALIRRSAGAPRPATFPPAE